MDKIKQKISIFSFVFIYSNFLFAQHLSLDELKSFESRDEANIRELREQEIRQINLVLKKPYSKDHSNHLYFRLAEIYLEIYRSTFLSEGRLYEKKSNKKTNEDRPDHSYSKKFIQLSLDSCIRILNSKIEYKNIDQVYYFLGFSYEELGNAEKSTFYYENILRKTPNSQLVKPVKKHLAEYFFNIKNYKKSKDYFENLINNSSEEDRPSFMYKLAWCYYRMKEYKKSSEIMKNLIQKISQLKDQYATLLSQSYRDVVLFLIESDDLNHIISYLFNSAPESSSYSEALEKLGLEYERRGKKNEAIKVYHSLVDSHYNNDSFFRIFLKLFQLDIENSKFQEPLSRLKKLFLIQSVSIESNSMLKNIKILTRKIATQHHQLYFKKKNISDLKIAESYYQEYLRIFFPNENTDDEKTEIMMYLAEVKQILGKNLESSTLCKKIIELKNEKYTKNTLVLLLKNLSENIKNISNSQKKEENISELENEFISTSDLFQKYANDLESREYSLQVAEILAGYKKTKNESIEKIKKIIFQWPKTIQAVIAAQLWFQMLLDDNPRDESALNQLVSELKSNSDLMNADKKFKKEKLKLALNEYEARLKVQLISLYEKNKEFLKAAQSYEELADQSFDPSLSEGSYLNSIINFSYVENSEKNIENILNNYLKKGFKKSAIQELLISIATRYFIDGQWLASAQLFEKIGFSLQNAQSLEMAAQIFMAIDQVAVSQNIRKKYLEQYKDFPRKDQIALKLAQSQEKAGLVSDAAHSYRFCAAHSFLLRAECLTNLADLYYKNKDFYQAKSLYRTVSDLGNSQKKEINSPFIAYSRFKLAQFFETEMQLEPLSFPEDQLKKSLNHHLAFLESLSKGYQSAVKAGGPWAISALYHLAKWVIHFAKEVDSIIPPSEITSNPVAFEKFKKDLSSVSHPLLEKGKAFLNQAYLKASEGRIFSSYLPSIVYEMTRLSPGSVGTAQGAYGHFHLVGFDLLKKSEIEEKIQLLGEKIKKNMNYSAFWVDYGNLLWLNKKSLLAKIAYEHALFLDSKNVSALNNLAVIKILSEPSGEDNPLIVMEAVELWESAIQIDHFFIDSKINLATLMNYYQMFSQAKSLWDQVLVQKPIQDTWMGLGVSLCGLKQYESSEDAFLNAKKLEGDIPQFVTTYHRFAKNYQNGLFNLDESYRKKCISELEDLEKTQLVGFEKIATQFLLDQCKNIKNKKEIQ